VLSLFTGVKGLLESISFFLFTSTPTTNAAVLPNFKTFFESKGYTVTTNTGTGFTFLHIPIADAAYIDVYFIEDPDFPFVFVAYINPNIQNPTSNLAGGTKYGSSYKLKLQNGASGKDYARVLYTTDGSNPDCVTNHGTSYNYTTSPELSFNQSIRLAVVGCLKANMNSDTYIYNYNLVKYSELNFKYDNYFGGVLNQPLNRPVYLRVTDKNGVPIPNLPIKFELKNGANWIPVKDLNKNSMFIWNQNAQAYMFDMDLRTKALKIATTQQFRAILPDGTSYPVLIKTTYC
jgi:hypothetical protein